MRKTTFWRTSKVDSKRNFNNILIIILAFIKPKKLLIQPPIFPLTLQRLVSDDFYLWERKCWNFSRFVASPSLCKTYILLIAGHRPSVLWKIAGKPDAGWLVRERIVTSILESLKSTNCKSANLISLSAFSSN